MRMTMRPYWANKRNLFLPLLLCCYMIVSGVLFYIAGQARTLVPKEAQDQLGSVGAAARFPLPGLNMDLQTLCFLFLSSSLVIVWLMMLQQAGIICNDLRNGAYTLYFSRPLRTRDYVVGKILGLLVLPVSILVVTILVAYVQAVSLVLNANQAWSALWVVARGVLASVAFTAVPVLSLLAASALASSERYAGAIYLIFWFLLPTTVRALAKMAGLPIFLLFSPLTNIQVLLQNLLQPSRIWHRDRLFREAAEYPEIALLTFVAYLCLFVLIIVRRMRSVEVVR
jgi:ABC-type transport system involved in multi-copper enzyme maturation permease subunit